MNKTDCKYILFSSSRSMRWRGGERKRSERGDPLHPPLQKWHNLRQKVKHMILQPGNQRTAPVEQNRVCLYFF